MLKTNKKKNTIINKIFSTYLYFLLDLYININIKNDAVIIKKVP